MTDPAPDRLAFFLGGHDLEMETIRDLVAEAAPERLFDKRLSWGAKASAYGEEIRSALARGLTPVLIELPDDLGLDCALIVVDHHGPRAGKAAPTSLHQIFGLLRLPPERWTRWLELVAANDRGHIRELRRLGATDAEIDRVRKADRAAQGVSEDDEAAAEAAVRNAQTFADGRLVVVRLPHSHASAAADRLELSDDPPENALVLSPTEANFYGRGALVRRLDERYPEGWSGGALPDRGFWGRAPVPPDIVAFLRSALEELTPQAARSAR
ncbi:MAG TPA: hypothetical protein VG323_06015 [Thermoanaerobaculia bacterium]|nr:hypothetical protein [Thermoanaerobaculia bacterium]